MVAKWCLIMSQSMYERMKPLNIYDIEAQNIP